MSPESKSIIPKSLIYKLSPTLTSAVKLTFSVVTSIVIAISSALSSIPGEVNEVRNTGLVNGASELVVVGNVYVCADHRIEDRFKLCSHHPDPEEIRKYWGSDAHRDLLQSINVDKECGRCTYGEYARQIEELAIGRNEKDPMCVDFP